MTIRNRRAVEIRVDELRDQGHTIREIAAKTGISVGSVHGILKRLEEAEEARWKRLTEAHGQEYRPTPKRTVKQVNAERRWRRDMYLEPWSPEDFL